MKKEKIPSSARCVVTGGAHGLGRALALELARAKSARLWIADINLKGAAETAEMAVKAGAVEAHAVQCDVSKKSDVEALAAQVQDSAGGADFVANNAGIAVAGEFTDIPQEDWEWILGINFNGVLYGCQAFLPQMKKQGSGRILNIASSAGLLNPPLMSPYNVTKSAVISLSESLQAELEGSNISVTVACPTFFPSKVIENGRIHTKDLNLTGSKMMTDSKATAESVAIGCLEAVESGQLHVLPTIDARLLWKVKRLLPRGTVKMMSWYLNRAQSKKSF